jgi:hypothetical protein
MAYKDFDGLSLGTTGNSEGQTLHVSGSTLELPDSSYISDAAIQRDGADLVLDGPQGTITVEGYFSALESPVLTAPDGSSLTPDLVDSFAQSPAQYAQNLSMNDASPIGAVNEATGDATITRTDGSIEQITIGTPVYQGDIVETSADGAVNIAFSDESSFAVSEDARMAIDEYVFDPDTEEGAQNFSALKGVFVFTSGLIGRDDPDDVSIDTPSGSIGIRGTIIAGNVDTGEITVVEGAIVLRDLDGNEMTLATQFETGKFGGNADGSISNLGQLSPEDVSNKFASVAPVAPALFSSVNDVAGENADAPEAPQDSTAEGAQQEDADANGSVDQNNDNEVDGTVDEAAQDSDASEDQGEGEGEAATDAEGEGKAQGEGRANTGPRGNENGLGGNNGGLGNDGVNASEAGNVGNTPPAGDENAGPGPNGPGNGTGNGPIGGENTNPPDPIDPRVIDPVDPGPTGSAPFSFNALPEAARPSTAPNGGNNNFFQTAEGQDWSYHFDKEFGDRDGDIVGFELSPASKAALLAAGGNSTFNPANGLLTVNVGITTGDTENIILDITARDSEGQTSTQSYSFDIFDAPFTSPTILGFGVGNDNKTVSLSGQQSFSIGSNGGITASDNANNNKVFLDDGDDTVTFENGNNTTLHLGNGVNAVTIEGGKPNQDNHIFGGNDTDTFTLQNGKNDIFGMDGDDTFILDLQNGSTRTDLLSGNGKVIDGGWDGANGDTLKFLDGGTPIDFANIQNTYFRGIERIDMTEASSTVIINTISYEDIVQMTDENNTLIFRGDDDVVLFDSLGATKDNTRNDVTFKDGATEFDVYEAEGAHGTVTILIEQNGGGKAAFTVSGIE